MIYIKVCVLRDDGGMLSVALNAAAIALLDSGKNIISFLICFALFLVCFISCFLILFSLFIIYHYLFISVYQYLLLVFIIIYYYSLSFFNFSVHRVKDAIFTEFCYRILPSDTINK